VGVTRTSDKGAQLSPLHGFGASSLPFSEHHPRPLGNNTGRGSRFFPHGTEQSKRPPNQEAGYNRSPSPPPPEEVSSHPAFTGDVHRPLVHLPTPKPRVKLPPQNTLPSPPPVTFASMVAAAPAVRALAQPIANTPSWQDRFNGLFGKKTSPGKKHVLAVTSATKEPLEVQSNLSSAAVSLPYHDEVEFLHGAGRVTSKEVEDEEAIFEDREAGSLPVVRVPNMAPRAPWQPVLPPSHSRVRSKFQKHVQALSIEPYIFSHFDRDNSGAVAIIIRLPGKDVIKTLTLPRRAGNQIPRSRGTSTFKTRKNVKPREGSGPYNNSQSAKKHPPPSANGSASSPRPPSGNGNWPARMSGTTH
jgi:hypothetical protein